jgi:tight adherence protein B
MDARTVVALLLLFGLGAVVLSIIVKRQKHPLKDRLDEFSVKRSGGAKNSQSSMLRETSDKRPGIFSKISAFTRLKLLRAGGSTDMRPFVTRVIIFALVGLVIGGPVAGKWGFLGGLFLGAMTPYLLIHMKFKRRMAKMEFDLPTALQFIVNALRAGHALNSAMAIVGSEGPSGCRDDFAQLNDSLRLGVPMSTAFEQLLNRTPSVDLRFMATAMLIQRETGGNLTEILDRLNSVVMERKRMRGQVQALTGQARMGGYVVGALPFFIAGGIFFMNAKHLEPLFKTELGNYVLGGACGLQFVGALVMKKIVNIKM